MREKGSISRYTGDDIAMRLLRALLPVVVALWLPSPSNSYTPNNLLILTTGNEIKLYPLGSQQDGFTIDGNNFYLLKPNLFSIQDSYRQSILPPSESSDNLEPHITEIDYFFDRRFCDQSSKHHHYNHDCLVVVWLDSASKLIRIGSTLLSGDLLDGTTMADGRPVWLDMFPSIEISRFCPKGNTQIKSIIVDRETAMLYITARSDNGRWRLLSDKLSADPSKQFHALCDPINFFCPSWNASLYIKSVDIDRESVRSLFLLEQFNDGARLGSVKPDRVFQYNDCEIKTFGGKFDRIGANDNHTVSAMTTLLEPARKLIWLTTDNELFVSNTDGTQTHQLGKLAVKPTIGSVYAMHVLHNTLFISDSKRKSLISIDLKSASSQYNASQTIHHQVIVVESLGLFGFQLIDLDRGNHSRRERSCQISLIQPILVLLFVGFVIAFKKWMQKADVKMVADIIKDMEPSDGGVAYEKFKRKLPA